VSKLALIRQYQYSPMAGGLIGKLLKGGAKLLGLGKKAATTVAPTLAKVAKNPLASGIAAGAGWAAGEALLSGSGGGSGSAGGWVRRRAKGITARELRGYRKVANLLHKEGMVSRRARGRK